MTRKHRFLTILSIVLFAILLIGCASTPTPDPSIVWSDDFEDGDLEGWEITDPGDYYYVEEGVLMCGPEKWAGILYESNVSIGTWSFDIFLPERMSGSDTVALFLDQEGHNGFGLEIQNFLEDTQIMVIILEDTQSQYPNMTRVPKVSGWNHMDITRDEIGNSKFYLNQKLVLEYKDDLTISPSSFFLIVNELGPALDNLIVRDQVIEIEAAE